MLKVDASSCPYCYIDIDINNHRDKLAISASFVDSTDSRYGFTSKDLRKLGGSELSRIEDLMESDHEWSGKKKEIGVEVRPPPAGNRIVVKLFWDVAPLCCENFATLCINGGNTLQTPDSSQASKTSKVKPAPLGESGKPLTYRESIVHRIVPGFVIQGGDFVFGNGTGGESIYGKKFKDEKAGLALKHDKRGVLSMGNSGKNSNTSQFFITFNETPQCNGKHVIFGEVISGFEVLDALEKVGSPSGEPNVPVKIIECGAFHPLQTPGSGYWYHQPDIESFKGFTPVFMVRPRIAIVSPSQSVYEKFNKTLGSVFTVTSILAESNDSEETTRSLINKLLQNFTVDSIIVAPTFASMVPLLEIPSQWSSNLGCDLAKEEIILVAKPIDALSVIQTKSWLRKQSAWQLDTIAL